MAKRNVIKNDREMDWQKANERFRDAARWQEATAGK